MQLSSRRGVEPLAASASLSLDADDILRAFSQADPDEQLFFDFFGPTWESQPIHRKLAILARIAELGAPPPPASTLGGVATLVDRPAPTDEP